MEYGVWRIDYTLVVCSVERGARRQGRLLAGVAPKLSCETQARGKAVWPRVAPTSAPRSDQVRVDRVGLADATSRSVPGSKKKEVLFGRTFVPTLAPRYPTPGPVPQLSYLIGGRLLSTAGIRNFSRSLMNLPNVDQRSTPHPQTSICDPDTRDVLYHLPR